MSLWTLNGTPLDELGVTFANYSFRQQAVSFCTFDSARNFDAAEVFPFGEPVTLAKNGTPFFQGKLQPITKNAASDYEGHDYALEDAWADLEATTYQEEWLIGAGSYFLPKAVLGLDSSGDPLTVGGQIAEVVAYAISQGVDLQMGSTPEGEVLWPEEVNNVTCAEVIRMSLRLNPDWIPWINHATTPPTLNVTPAASLTPLVLATNGTGILESFSETTRSDLIPDAVRIIYEFATTIDDEVYRDAIIDKFPLLGPDGGPKVICVTLPLAGGQMQIQKSRIKVRPIPEPDETSTARAKKWIRAKYLHMAEVPDEEFTITEFEPSVWEEPDTGLANPPPINPQAPALEVADWEDLPNELLEGSIEDWMRRRVGWIKVHCACTAAEGASAETIAAIAKGFPDVRFVATNAITKIYKGVAHWAAPEDVPSGIAQAFYEGLANAYLFEGRATLVDTEVSSYQGRKLTLTGAATNNAPVTEVSGDVATGRTVLTFGVSERLAPADLLEVQRNLRRRKVTWWSKAERESNRLGAELKPSASGDSVSGYHQPQTIFETGVGSGTGANGCPFGEIITVGEDKAIRGGTLQVGDKNFDVPAKVFSTGSSGSWLVFLRVPVTANIDDAGEILLPGVETSTATDPAGFWELDAWSAGPPATQYEDNTRPVLSTGVGEIIIPIGKLTVAAGVGTLSAARCGNITVNHCGGTLTAD
jgi:hypothetical protein